MGSARVGSNPILVDNFFQGNILIFVRLHPNTGKHHMPPWRNRLARSAVNRKVGGSSPPGGAPSFDVFSPLEGIQIKRMNLMSILNDSYFVSKPSRRCLIGK